MTSHYGAPDNLTPRGILKLTRHPGFVAFAIFGFAHMLMNGWAGDVVFFGTFPALGIFGGLRQDYRKLRSMGERYRRFVEHTSFIPVAALLSGRQQCHPGADLPLLATAIGAVLTIVLIAIHPWAFLTVPFDGHQPAGPMIRTNVATSARAI